MNKDIYNIKDIKDMSFEAKFTIDEEGLRGLAAFLKEQDDEILDAIFNGKQGLILHDPKRGTVEVSRVVRCKDCIHRPVVINPDKPDCGFNLRPPQNDEGYEDWSCHFLCDDGYYSRMPSDDDFCSWGNRKGGDNNECE